jgi:two-component system response regulator YesN
VRDKRLTYAKQLLRQKDLPLKAVAYEAGFTDPNYFSRTFKKIEGVPPSKYLASH